MYSYEELMNMDETRLRELASSMGMKKQLPQISRNWLIMSLTVSRRILQRKLWPKTRQNQKLPKRRHLKRKRVRNVFPRKNLSLTLAPSAESVTENAEIANDDTAAATDAPAPKKRYKTQSEGRRAV